MSEKSPCEDCIWNARTWYKEGVNQTIEEVLKIVLENHKKLYRIIEWGKNHGNGVLITKSQVDKIFREMEEEIKNLKEKNE